MSEAQATFTRDWFSNKKHGILKRFPASLIGKPNLKYLEIGVFEGRSVCWMFDNILTGPGCSAIGIDPYSGYDKARLINNVDAIHARAISNTKTLPFTLIHSTSYQVIYIERRFEPNAFDIIHVDGDHRAVNAYLDMMLCWPLLKRGGVMIGDDYALDVAKWGRTPLVIPKPAYDQFVAEHATDAKVLHYGKNIIIQKL